MEDMTAEEATAEIQRCVGYTKVVYATRSFKLDGMGFVVGEGYDLEIQNGHDIGVSSPTGAKVMLIDFGYLTLASKSFEEAK